MPTVSEDGKQWGWHRLIRENEEEASTLQLGAREMKGR
jgi:hypothetical protein